MSDEPIRDVWEAKGDGRLSSWGIGDLPVVTLTSDDSLIARDGEPRTVTGTVEMNFGHWVDDRPRWRRWVDRLLRRKREPASLFAAFVGGAAPCESL